MKPSSRPLVVMLLASGICGALNAGLGAKPGQLPPLFFVLGVIDAICLFSWCKRDAEARHFQSGASAMLVGLATPLGIPYYFFRSRSFGQACLMLLKALLFWVLISVIYSLAFLASQSFF